MILIASKQDPAGMNIVKEVRKYSSIPVRIVDEDIIYADVSDIKTGYIIFASRHESKDSTPTLSVHATGNFSEAKFGGVKRELSVAYASKMKTALKFLKRGVKNSKKYYRVSMEATHHGPLVQVPHFFIETGPTEEQWNDPTAIKIITYAIIQTVNSTKTYPVAIGIGDGHFATKMTKYTLETEYAIGHICPKFNVKYLDDDMLNQMIDRNESKAVLAVVDKELNKSQKEYISQHIKSVFI